MALNIFGAQPAGGLTLYKQEAAADYSDRPQFKWGEQVGKVAIFSVERPDTLSVQGEEKDVLRARIIVIANDGSVEEFPDSIVWPGAPYDQLKTSAGQHVVGVVDKKKSAKGFFYNNLGEPTPAQAELANKYAAANPQKFSA